MAEPRSSSSRAICAFTTTQAWRRPPAPAEYVVPVFVLDDEVLDRAGPNRVAFLVEALADLRESLRQRGADLVIRRGDPVAETLRLCRDVGAGTVFVGEDVSPYARRREQRLATACQSAGVELRVEHGTTVVPPGAVAPDGGDHYRVFTPYWRRWREAPRRRPLSAPARLRLPSGVAAVELPSAHELTGRAASPGVARGGEREGRRRLTRWLADGLPSYAERRDRLDVDGTSRLSAYLHFGCLSPLEVVTRAQEHPGSDEFVRQLCWRDFFHQLLAGQPRNRAPRPASRHDDRRSDHDALERWRGGLTGYPIVDAGMRQLAREGWLPNRARLIVGSFLTRNLGLDWRSGAAVFFELLVDGDVASNAGNWQWVAGTGAEHASQPRVGSTGAGTALRPGRRLRAKVGSQSSARSRGRSCTSRGTQRIRSSHPSTPLRSSSPRRLRCRGRRAHAGRA